MENCYVLTESFYICDISGFMGHWFRVGSWHNGIAIYAHWGISRKWPKLTLVKSNYMILKKVNVKVVDRNQRVLWIS